YLSPYAHHPPLHSVPTRRSSDLIKVLCNLLERRVARLDEEEVHDRQLDRKPDAVDDVVLPSDLIEGNGVDVVVEEERKVDEQEQDRKSTRLNSSHVKISYAVFCL